MFVFHLLISGNDFNEVQLFHSNFIERNKNKLKLIIDGKEQDLIGIYKLSNNNKDILKVKLKGITNVTDMSWMFYGCSSLTSLPDIYKWNTTNVTDMSYMFCGCSSLTSLPDISKWNTTNVTDMSCMFDGCKSSLNIPSKFKKH